MAIVMESDSKHEFVTNLDEDLPEALIDGDKFGQIIGNLLTNAVKYSPEGGRIIVTARKDRSNRGW